MSLERLAGAVSQGFLLGRLRPMDFVLKPSEDQSKEGRDMVRVAL